MLSKREWQVTVFYYRRNWAHHRRQARLQSDGIDSEEILEETIRKLEGQLRKARKKDNEIDETPEEPSFPLLEIADADVRLLSFVRFGSDLETS